MIWLLRIDGLGAPVYLASASVVPLDGSTRLPHLPYLSGVDVGQAFELATDSALADAGGAVRVILPRAARLAIEGGWRLDRATAELSLWAPGTPYRARVPIWRGRVSPQGSPVEGQPVDLDLVPADLSDGQKWPPEDARVVTGETWDDPGDAAVGEAYPFPFGGGVYLSDDKSLLRTSASRALLVDQSVTVPKVIVAGGPVRATEAVIYSAPDEDDSTFTLNLEQDGRGRWVTTATLTAKAGPGGWDFDTAEFYVTRWGPSESASSPDGSAQEGALRGWGAEDSLDRAGALLRFLLDQQVVPSAPLPLVDLGALRGAAAALDYSSAAGQIRGPELPWDWAREHLLSLFPGAYFCWGPRGWFPVVLSQARREDCSEVVEGRDFYRRAQELPAPSSVTDPPSSAAVRFALRVRTDQMVALEELRPGYSMLLSPAGDGPALDLDAAAIYARADALAAAHRHVAAAQPALSVVYVAPLSAWRRWELGRRVRLTDAGLGLSERPAWLTGLRFTTALLELSFSWR